MLTRLRLSAQALNSLLFPVFEDPESLQAASALQRRVLAANCVGVLLRALHVNSAAYDKGACQKDDPAPNENRVQDAIWSAGSSSPVLSYAGCADTLP